MERKNGVLQDRLVKEMRLQGINSIKEGNAFLPQFLEEFNQRFGHEPTSKEDAPRPLRKRGDLEQMFFRKDVRKLSKDLTFQHKGILYLIETKTPNCLKRAAISVFWKEGTAIQVYSNADSNG